MTAKKPKSEVIFNRLKRNPDLMEDRREYDVEDLARAYDLNEKEAADLAKLIKDYISAV
jgi:hypothetical protein